MVAFCGTNHGKGNTGIARGRFHNDLVVGEETRLLRRQDHVQGNTVLDRAPGVTAFQLCEDADLRVGVEVPDLDKRGIPNCIKDWFVSDAQGSPGRYTFPVR